MGLDKFVQKPVWTKSGESSGASDSRKERMAWTYDALKRDIQDKNIQSPGDYNNRRKENGWPMYKTLEKFAEFQTGGWNDLLGREWKKEWIYSELKQSVQNAGINSSSGYEKIRKEQGWPVKAFLGKMKEFQAEGWDGFFGRESKPEWTYENLKEDIHAKGIKRPWDYEQVRKKHRWPVVHTIRKFPEFQKEGWNGFFGRDFREYEMLKADVRAKGVESITEYNRLRKEYGWPSEGLIHKFPQLENEGWRGFFGNEAKRKWTYAELKAEVHGKGIDTTSKYSEVSSKYFWPDLQTVKRRFPELENEGWESFFRREKQTYEALKAEVRANNVHSSHQYNLLSSKNRWISIPTLRKLPEFQLEGWGGFLGREPDWTYEDLKLAVRQEQINSSEQYNNSRKLHGWPTSTTLYKKFAEFGAEGWDGFLGREPRPKWTYETLKADVRAKGINASYIYERERQKNKWPVSLVVRKFSEFQKEGWDGFLGRVPSLDISGLQDQLRNYLSSPSDIDEFKRHISLFGAAQNLDVLYALRPEYKDIPPERLKGMMAEFLGSYLLSPAPFDPNKMEGALIRLKNDSLREGLREVIKNDCLHTILKVRKANPNLSEKDLFDNYFLDLRKKCERYDHNAELEQTIKEVEEYYRSVLKDFEKPGGTMVKELQQGRKFPDLYQKINVKEISDKKRMLIADEMGVGKSASAILAKEELCVKTALIVAPKNVIPTWERYLSDTMEDGKQIGYFKPGFAPKVLMIDSAKNAAEIPAGAYDYIIISQEKLSRDEYVEPLLRTEYDMLIADEIHELKNVREGKRSQSILELADKIQGENQYLALLSGTPVPNKVEDVAILLKLLYPEKFAAIETKQMVLSIIKGDLADLRTLLVPRMQMKSLAENVEMPKLIERTVRVPLSRAEEEIYQVLLDEDELTPVEKMHALRQFVLNPNLLNVAPKTPCSKLEALKNELDSAFKKHDKVLVFVNDYIEDVIRGEQTIMDDIVRSNEIKIETIHGGTSDARREEIQKSFNAGTGKMLLFVSGSTAAVGVDYSGADHLIFYNEPWTKADKDQQRSRPYRPGLSHDLESVTILAENTIDEGIHRYIEAKFNVVNKLLKGIPITEFEQKLATVTEKERDQNLEVNAELARYYFSVFDKLNRMFASVKQIGEEKFQVWLEKNGGNYAGFYGALGGRSYQANGSRVAAGLIREMAREKGIENPRVLDMGSGPEMLRKHSLEKYQSNIFSADINEAQFSRSTSGTAAVASYANTPFAANTFDFINMSLVLDHSQFIPSKNKLERVKVLSEMSRDLKVGGRGMVNEEYSHDFADRSKLPEIAVKLGLRVVEEYSGQVQSGEIYKSNIVTFEKVAEPPDNPEETIKNLPQEVRDGLKFKPAQAILKDRRRIVTDFMIGSKQIPILLNARDRMLQEAEQKILDEGEKLKKTYGSIEAIPYDIVDTAGFHRIGVGKNWILFKASNGSAIIVR